MVVCLYDEGLVKTMASPRMDYPINQDGLLLEPQLSPPFPL